MARLKILVVDDNQDFCESVRDILEAEGHEVQATYDGQSAVELAQKECFGLILMDLVIPGMDGVTAIKAIRKTSPSVPIIVVTAFGEESIIEEAFRAGANKQFGKPIDFNRLLADISKNDHYGASA
ncbi:MAG: response regulator [Chloroflexi bacterium]|nr:response regulator [Chloroflexota bacterium]